MSCNQSLVNVRDNYSTRQATCAKIHELAAALFKNARIKIAYADACRQAEQILIFNEENDEDLSKAAIKALAQAELRKEALARMGRS